MQRTARRLAVLSRWIDEHPDNAARDAEAITWGRLAKVSEECGEVIEAFIGATGQNPRKGVTHTRDDVAKELLDVAVTALAAYEHMTGNRGRSMAALEFHTSNLIQRAGLANSATDEPSPAEHDRDFEGRRPERGPMSSWSPEPWELR